MDDFDTQKPKDETTSNDQQSEFEFRDKIEGWVEGLLEVFQTYLGTCVRLTVPLKKTLKLLTSEGKIAEFTQPSVYLVVSYVVMCFLIRDVDFSDRFFSTDIAQRLDALGVLDAAKTIKDERLVVSVFPAIVLLWFFVFVSSTILTMAGDTLDPTLLRRNYAFSLGGFFLTIGAVAGGYYHLVKPVAATSWWWGLPIHILTMLPLVNVIIPCVAINFIGKPTFGKSFVRWVAVMVPLVGILLLLKLTIGTFSLMDYMKLR